MPHLRLAFADAGAATPQNPLFGVTGVSGVAYNCSSCALKAASCARRCFSYGSSHAMRSQVAVEVADVCNAPGPVALASGAFSRRRRSCSCAKDALQRVKNETSYTRYGNSNTVFFKTVILKPPFQKTFLYRIRKHIHTAIKLHAYKNQLLEGVLFAFMKKKVANNQERSWK